ncbi:Uncharacterized protein TCM_033714 [Theobroma cacao]|uniref:Reverse transcriptase domain-containing protein n=1 Tax=Theobroma cacao TaxID=3641 RepID=A0A061FBQ5_THECC|nr:Uncharacterized protein TCM_033714 [Theobroma cacao]
MSRDLLTTVESRLTRQEKDVVKLADRYHGRDEIQRLKVQDITVAIVIAESLIEFHKPEAKKDAGKGKAKVGEETYVATLSLNKGEPSKAAPMPSKVATVMDEYVDVMPAKLSSCLPLECEVDQKIELVLSTQPLSRAPYRMAPSKLVELHQQLIELIEAGFIRPSKAPYDALVRMSPKTRATLRRMREQDAPIEMVDRPRASTRRGRGRRGRATRPVRSNTLVSRQDEGQSSDQKNWVVTLTIRNCSQILNIFELFDQLGKARVFSKLNLWFGYYQVWITEGDQEKTACVTRFGSFEFLVMLFGLTNAPAMFCTLMNKVLPSFLDKFAMVYLDNIIVYSRIMAKHVGHLRAVFERLRACKLLPQIRTRLLQHRSTLDRLAVKDQAWGWSPDSILMQQGHPMAYESRKLNDTERRYMAQEKDMTVVVHYLRVWRHYLLGARFVVKIDNVANSFFETQISSLSSKLGGTQNWQPLARHRMICWPISKQGLQEMPLPKPSSSAPRKARRGQGRASAFDGPTRATKASRPTVVVYQAIHAIGVQAPLFNQLPPLNKWADKADEPLAGDLLVALCPQHPVELCKAAGYRPVQLQPATM